ncbi:hypothetical protein [Tenacibaculum dicentrarchi]|uniref:TM2 domain-containing protein n=1 Tax=Tenacibaculum dicentrarchi TaxID=669041 RepID=A0ABP1EP72_9FLAO|nr:conserved membrane hypothetical protein [Tenacibaculum dicentrarchi]SOS52867.1 conserved membrane hypothetical protein [Tenacibaculum dicentrarchi]SOU87718.1 conserved membrane hypothetical protein [Tenacibaculum dicentrarchi]
MNSLQVENKNITVNSNQKSVGISLLLTIFLGPLGLLYSTNTGFIVMLIFNIFLAIITTISTLFLGFLGLFILIFGFSVIWIIQIIWGIIAVNNYNSQNTNH